MRQTGYILVSTIIMITLMSLMVLSLLQEVYLNFKINNQLVEDHHLFYQLETIGGLLAQRLATENGCLLVNQEDRISAELLRHLGCKLYQYNQEYDYAYTELPSSAASDPKNNLHQWLISVTSNASSSHMLQLRIARSVSNHLSAPTRLISWLYK